MTPACNIKIESFTPNEEQLSFYVLEFKERIPKWQNYLGESIFMSQEGFEEDGEKLLKVISKSKTSKLKTLLKKHEVLPEKLFRITEISTGISISMPIYTGIHQISLEGSGSVLAKAFFGSEVHLLDATGKLLSRHRHDYVPKLGQGQRFLIDCNDLYDSQVKGRQDDETNVEIVGYAPDCINQTCTFNSQKGEKYILRHSYFQYTQEIIGTGLPIEINNLSFLGTYEITTETHEAEWLVSVIVKFSHHVGQKWKDIRDFTIQYNTFPYLGDRDKWVIESDILSPETRFKHFNDKCKDVKFVEELLGKDPCSFQFMPLEIRKDRFWVEKFSLREPVNFLFVDSRMRNDKKLAIDLIRMASKYDDTIYAYLPEVLRKDLDILIALKELERLFHLPEPDEVGSEKFRDIREFVCNNFLRIHKLLNIFPNALRYAPEELLENRELILQALLEDKQLVSHLPLSFRDDAEIIIAASGDYFASLEFASPRLREDPDFVMQLIELNGRNLCFAADWMKWDIKFVLAAAKAGSILFDYISEHFRDDEEVVLEMIKENGYSLTSASDRLRRDKPFNLKALDHGAYYKHCIHESLLEDRDIVLKAIQKRLHQFKDIPEKFKSDREIVLAVVSSTQGYGYGNGGEIAECSLDLRDDKEVVTAALSTRGSALKYASERLQDDKEIVLTAVSNYGSALQYASKRLQDDKDIVLVAVANSGGALEYASDRCRDDNDIVLAALTDKVYALRYASERLKEDKNFIVKVVTEDVKALNYISDILKDDKEVILAAVSKYGYALEYASERLRDDEGVVLTAVSNYGNALKYASDRLKIEYGYDYLKDNDSDDLPF